jgi:glucose-6-phosphate-specific signal transduction histidine kinase
VTKLQRKCTSLRPKVTDFISLEQAMKKLLEKMQDEGFDNKAKLEEF